MPSGPTSSRRNDNNNTHNHAHQITEDGIDKLDYKPGGRALIPHATANGESNSGRQSEDRSYAGSFFEEVAEGIAAEDRKYKTREVVRYVSFIWAIVNCLGAGSITAYSLYAPLFQQRLRYTQLQVNGVSIAAELAMYLPVPLFGLLCDRTGPGVPSLLSGIWFGLGYLVAAFVYKSGPPHDAGGDGWPYLVMVVAFISVGCGTSCMYLSAVTTCAKNFGRGKYKGLALSLPIACFGLSSMWQSQVGSRLLYEPRPDGSRGDVDVHHFFLFLGILLSVTGFVGYFALRVVDEPDLIDEAIEELEQSGLLEESSFFQPHQSASGNHQNDANYGTLSDNDRRLSAEEFDELNRNADEQEARLLEDRRKKNWLLNEETRRFLTDHTMWWLAAGFFLVTGPGDAFINNLGTIIGTLNSPISVPENSASMTSAATQVSILAITSTLARIITGSLTDLVAPSSPSHQHRRGPNSLENSFASLPPPSQSSKRWEISRVIFVIAFSLLMSVGQVLLASGALQNHGQYFWLVSSSIGASYGAVFTLTPIIISVVWGVENFGTNWGIVTTAAAVGATFWGLVYSAVYQWAAARPVMGLEEGDGGAEDVLCHGKMCYAPTFWAMAGSVWVAVGLWAWAWRGPSGWIRRAVAV